jgi:ribosome-associated heat shock protein Hsp15
MSGPDASAIASAGALPGQRLDKWLWYARVTKSRTLAAHLIEDGKVRVNRARTDKPSHVVRAGDVITATVHRNVRVLKVLAPGTRRGPATEARSLYEELTPQAPTPASSAGAGDAGVAHSPSALQGNRVPGSGRPTKRERRLLDKFRNGGS